jgi:sugar/nucleoside kinase (ribokinase family)
MNREIDLLVPGEINPDLILSGDVSPAFGQIERLVDAANLTIGSSSAIFACGAARLGLRVAFVGVCGDDLFGHFMLDELSRRGIDTTSVIMDPALRTGLSVILARGADRAILTYPGCIAALRAEQVPDRLLERARHVHVASYFLQSDLQEGLPALFRRAHARGATTSLDTNWDPSGTWRVPAELLSLVDVLLPNEAEALALSRAATIEVALARLSEICRAVAVKRGPAGGLARQGAVSARAAAVEVQVVDTVGAGDSFDAGFLFGWLNDYPLEKALRLGTICGSLSTREAGGTAAQPTRGETEFYVA